VSINAVLGALTVLAASSLGPAANTTALVLAMLCAAFFKASVYMMMQLHQIQEDKVRGDISVAVMYGRNTTLRAAMLFIALAGICAAASLVVSIDAYVLAVLTLGYICLMGYRFHVWLGRPEQPQQDYLMVRQMVALSGYLGSVICLGAFLYFNAVGY
jgi:4-hydroxybenzoate polyprenyltransferase